MHSHWMRDMVWMHVAALAWGGKPQVRGWWHGAAQGLLMLEPQTGTQG